MRRQSPSTNARKVRAKRFDAGRCTRCGRPLPDDDFRAVCRGCARWSLVTLSYKRHFERDFT